MRNQYTRSITNAFCPMLFVGVCCAVLTMVLSSCGGGRSMQHEASPPQNTMTAAPYSIVCIIHGDGDYLYHDTAGNEHTADEEAVAGAQRVAQQNPQAEVFIFHQKPRDHVLFLFARHDGEFFYYRNGQLIAQELYWRDDGKSRFDTELEFYRRYHPDNRSKQVNVFLYCGHEIPEAGGAGYDASYSDRPFTVHDLAAGLQGFTGGSTRFELVVLSTCFGGTPYTIGTLGRSARHIIASPDNLHLSYFDLHSLEHLELKLKDGNVSAFSHRFASLAFDRLTRDVQTAVTVAVYDVDRVQEFLHAAQPVYDRSLARLGAETPASIAASQHCDCADIPAYALPGIHEGVEVFYRPAHFGRSTHKQDHSGWECWKEQ